MPSAMSANVAISGVNRGIGEGLALAFLGAGWNVHGFGRVQPLWADQYADRFAFHHCDMADHASVAAACEGLDQPLDVLICSAATFGNGAFYCNEFDPAAFKEAFAVNVVAPAVMAQQLQRQLANGARRLIIMMSTGNASLSGNVQGEMMAYRSSKSALNQLVRNLAAEWGAHGFTTVALNPGWVRTDMGGAQAPTSITDASQEILNFVADIANSELNGLFINADGGILPW